MDGEVDYARIHKAHFEKRELRIFGIKVLADGILPCIQVYALAGVIESFSEMLKNKTGGAEFILSAAVLIGMIAYNWISRQYAEERTIFQFQDFIENKWEEQYEIQRKKQIKAFMKYFVKVKLFGVMSTAVILVIEDNSYKITRNVFWNCREEYLIKNRFILRINRI